MLTLIKEQTTEEYDQIMKAKYGSMEKLEEQLKKTPTNILYAELNNWKLLLQDPEKNIKVKEIIITDNLNIGENKQK